MGWKDAPLAEPEGGQSPRWASAPLVEEAKRDSAPSIAMAPIGGLEMLLKTITGGIGSTLAYPPYAVASAVGAENPSGLKRRIQDFLTYQPVSDSARAGEQALGDITRPVAEPVVRAADRAATRVGQVSPFGEALMREAPGAFAATAGLVPTVAAARTAATAPFRPSPLPKLTPIEDTFMKGREAGYVVPPSTVKPSAGNVLLESVGGKAATQQVASRRNQEVTNKLAREALGLDKDAPLTRETLENIRAQAGQVYDEVAKSGEVRPDQEYLDDLISLQRSADDIMKDFPDANVASAEEVQKLTNSLLRDKFDAKSALAYLKELRSQASSNLSFQASADPAKRALGMAQREAAATLEDLVMRHLRSQGKEDLAGSFDGARRKIAKTYSVQNALNETTQNVVASQLGNQLKKGKPLSGELELAARFARAFPKATEEIRHSGPVSALDGLIAGTGSIGAFGAGAPEAAVPFLLWPAARLGAREWLLSQSAQNSLIRRPQAFGGGVPPEYLMMGAAPAAAGLFSDQAPTR